MVKVRNDDDEEEETLTWQLFVTIVMTVSLKSMLLV